MPPEQIKCSLPVNTQKCEDDNDYDPSSWDKEEWACFLNMDSTTSISRLIDKIRNLKSQFASKQEDPCNEILEMGLTSLENINANQASNQTSNQASNQTSNQASNQTSNQTSNKASNQTSNQASNQTSNQASEPTNPHDTTKAPNYSQELYKYGVASNHPSKNQIVVGPGTSQIQKRNITPQTNIKTNPQGIRNPILRETYTTNVVINSQYRTNPVATSSSNFLLDINMKQVLSIRLHSVKIPPSWYPFDYNFGNNFFGVTSTSGSINDLSCVDITPGNYDASGLIQAVNTSMTTQGISATLTWSAITNKITLQNTSATDLSFVFYDQTSTKCDSSGCINYNSSINNNLGYFLGFRNIATNGAPQNNLQNLIIQIPPMNSITAQAQLNLNTKITAIISFDDFNNNLFSEKIKLIESKNVSIQMPSYYDRFDLSCNQNPPIGVSSKKSHIITASNPRKKTQAQLYTLQQILNHNVISHSITAKSIRNTLGMFSLIAGEFTHKTFTITECSPKLYMGPVNLERAHLTIQDSNGYILNMNYADWECGLEVEQMHQY